MAFVIKKSAKKDPKAKGKLIIAKKSKGTEKPPEKGKKFFDRDSEDRKK